MIFKSQYLEHTTDRMCTQIHTHMLYVYIYALQ